MAICYPYGASTEDALKKLECDLYYLKNFSIPLDFVIIFNTVKNMLFQKGGPLSTEIVVTLTIAVVIISSGYYSDYMLQLEKEV